MSSKKPKKGARGWTGASGVTGGEPDSKEHKLLADAADRPVEEDLVEDEVEPPELPVRGVIYDKKIEIQVPTPVMQKKEGQTEEDIVKSKGYEMGKELGHGAFATVYKVNRLKDNYPLAVKVVDLSKRKRKRISDLRYELYVLKKCDHPNMVKLFDDFIIGDKFYIFMELASGGTLSDYIRKKGPLKEAPAKVLFRHITLAIQHMHSKGLSHRDLKLGNILLTEDKECKVTDFGLSRVSYKKEKGIVFCTSYCGTEPYMAPEILKKLPNGKRHYDPIIADVWAMGVCLYAMVNKAYPFNPEDKELMLQHQLNRKWKFVRKQRQRLSDEVKDLIKAMLEPNPKKRIICRHILIHPWLHEDE